MHLAVNRKVHVVHTLSKCEQNQSLIFGLSRLIVSNSQGAQDFNGTLTGCGLETIKDGPGGVFVFRVPDDERGRISFV